jgi:predicted dienelactone hydrolase
MEHQRRSFSEEYKRQAVEPVVSSARSVTSVTLCDADIHLGPTTDTDRLPYGAVYDPRRRVGKGTGRFVGEVQERHLSNIVHRFVLATALLLSFPAFAEPFRAGISRISVAGETPFEILIAYPTEIAEVDIDEDAFKVRASEDAPIVPGTRFPIILFAKGNGRAAGSPFVHHDMILRMAREGFVVIAPFYPGTSRPFVSRPKQTRSALDAAILDERFSGHIDPKRIGMIGYSFGGALTLMMGGAKLNLARLSAYCREHRDDPRACDGIPTDGSLANVPSRKSDDAVSLKALVLLEPYGAPFGKEDLISIDMPVMIYRALQSDLKAEGNVLSLAQNLPKSPRLIAVPGGHGVFIAPCPPSVSDLSAEESSLCKDGTDVDRIAIHDRAGDEISQFFRANL